MGGVGWVGQLSQAVGVLKNCSQVRFTTLIAALGRLKEDPDSKASLSYMFQERQGCTGRLSQHSESHSQVSLVPLDSCE